MTSPSTRLARTVVTALRGSAVREVVIAPGSRNAPLSFALYDAAQAGGLRLHTRIDERTAGFLALGLAKVGNRPAAVICTSGTAVAHLLPAVMEAAHAGVPLVVVTADRPARLRGTGANQTTDQVGIFGTFAPTLDVAAADLDELLAFLRTHDGQRPMHLNVQLDDPLLPDDGGWDGGEAPEWAVPAVGPADGAARPRPGSAHGRGGRRRRRSAGEGPRREGRLAPARRAVERLPHRRQRDPHLPAAAGRRARAAGRAGGRATATRPSPGRSRAFSPVTTSRSCRCATVAGGRSGRSR